VLIASDRSAGFRRTHPARGYVKAGNWYGRWWVGDQRVKRKLGAVRDPGSRTGLTKSQAEREMRRRMDAETASVSVGDRLTVSQAGERLVDQLEVYGLRPTTIAVYRSLLRTHLGQHLGDRELARVTPGEVEWMIAAMSTKRRRTQAHQQCDHAARPDLRPRQR